jgi:hypothetical protein
MTFESRYDEWLQANTVKYRSFDITHGSVRDASGNSLMMSYCPLCPTQEQIDSLNADAKLWIDERLAKAAA